MLPLLLLTSAALHATPLVTAQPTGQTAFAGDADAYFQIRETGAASYQWQVKTGGTGTAVNVSGTRYKNAATPLLRIVTPDATLDGNTYGCVISDGSGSVTTAFVPLKVFAAPTATAPVVTLGTSTISANSTADISLQITGLATGQSVRIERVLDLNADTKPGAGEPLIQSFTVTDGTIDPAQPNIPGDQDATANGQIATAFSLASSPDLGRTQGTHLIRITSPTGAFLPITKTLAVQGNSYGQNISGQVRDAASAAVGYSVVMAVQGSTIVASAVAAANGNYNLWVPVGTYSVVPVSTGYTASEASQPTGTVASGVNSTAKNPVLTTATATVSGRVLDASGSPALRGVQLTAISTNGYVSILTSDSDGNYVVPTIPGTWTIHGSPASLHLLGYLEPATAAQATTTAGSVTSLDLLFASSSTPASYATWKTTAGFSESDLTTAAISGESADPDGDGLTNLMEYALGGSPKVADAATIAPAVDSNGSQIQISFHCDDSRKDIIYSVQSSSDLAPNSWTDIAQSIGGGPMTAVSGRSTVTDPGSGARTVIVSTALPVSGKLFLRVKAAK
ncbi:MAG: carboxypeptidase-like regulatory domain-containing protein [Verrucomicrobia bacterium]|nr:carboxypeptidase-like regulatory domain-containing protein [Verrucomicrobiota bacterium]